MSHHIGIDLGGTNIAAGVVDEAGQLLTSVSLPTLPERGVEAVLDDMCAAAASAAKQVGATIAEIDRIGVGVPGFLDADRRVLRFSGNIGMYELPLAHELESRLGHKVTLENDANAAALAELYFGAAKGAENMILLLLGTGVGSGIIINRRIYSGSDGHAGEIAHTVLDPHGEMCMCGQSGCVETMVSASALNRQAEAALLIHPESMMREIRLRDGRLTGQGVFKAAAAGDETARALLSRFTDSLALVVGNCVSVFRPDMVLIGGGLSNAGDALLSPLREKLPAHVVCSSVLGVPPVRRALLGSEAGIIGAAMLGYQE